MVDFKAFSDETVKIASITSGIIHGGLPGAIVGGLGGMVYDKQDRARGMAHGAGLGFLGGSALGALGTWRPAKRLQDMALDAVGKERELIKRIKASTDYAEQSALSAERRALNTKVEQESKRLGELVQVGGGLPGFAAGLGGGLYAKHKADSQKRSRRKLKTAADMRGLDSEQKEELRQFLKNTALIGIGTGVGGGIIINIASRAAFRGDKKDYMAYAASKAGVVGLTRSIAQAYGKDGIKAFLVAPGFVKTEMAQDFIDEYGEENTLGDMALNQITEPADIARFVAFLASGLADHATGGTFDINAGSYVH